LLRRTTRRSASERAYRVVTLTDRTATPGAEERRGATEKDLSDFSLPMTHDAFLAALAWRMPALPVHACSPADMRARCEVIIRPAS
jgi:hypothetical protein